METSCRAVIDIFRRLDLQRVCFNEKNNGALPEIETTDWRRFIPRRLEYVHSNKVFPQELDNIVKKRSISANYMINNYNKENYLDDFEVLRKDIYTKNKKIYLS